MITGEASSRGMRSAAWQLPFTQAAAESREAVRKRIVTLVFVVYWLLIFEGVLRKWVLPQLSDVLFFLKDPFVIAIYYLAFRYRLWPQNSTMFWLGVLLAALYIPLVLLQAISYDFPILVSGYGWRNYFFYLPLAFIIGCNFRGEDLARLVKYTLLVAIPLAVLVFFQFLSPPDAFVNRTYSEDAEIFTVTKDIVRTYGTFTFTTGQVIFVASTIAMLLAVWILPKDQRPLHPMLLIAATVAVITSFAVNGSRAIFFYTALTLAATVFSGIIAAKQRIRFRAAILPIVLATAGALIFINVFTTSWEAIQERQQVASGIEGSPVARALKSFTEFTNYIIETPVLGHGVGYGTGGGAKLATGKMDFTLVEDEWSRVLLESGVVLGLLYIAYRILLVSWLFVQAVRATRRSHNPLPLALLGFIGIVLLNGQITSQGTIMGYGWLFAGFLMAANRLGLRPGSEADAWK
ncbi:MAG: hypothetical protein ACOY5C_13265 [Pseudomonadota bacterium]